MSLRKLGSFIKIKQWNTAIGYYEKSNAKSMDIDMETNLLLLNRMEAKEFEKAVKKAMDMVDVFPSALSIIIPV
jgi:hypothetical protein